MKKVNAQAGLRTEVIGYKHGDTVLEGHLAYDDAVKGNRPGVIVVHAWMTCAGFVGLVCSGNEGRPNYLLVNEYTNSTNVKNNLDPDDMVTDLSSSLLSLREDILSPFDS